jgi:hypothetical protein
MPDLTRGAVPKNYAERKRKVSRPTARRGPRHSLQAGDALETTQGPRHALRVAGWELSAILAISRRMAYLDVLHWATHFAFISLDRAECFMRKRRLKTPESGTAKDLWVNPRSNLRGVDGSRAWDNGGNISPASGARFLELADIALGLKKPASKRRRAAGASAHLGDHAESTARKNG